MAMRLNEVHPALTHFPIALLPAALGVDVAAKLTGRDDLARLGRVAMPVVTTSALLTAASGLMAERQVRGSEEAMRMLGVHRNLNLAAGGATVGMAAYRAKQHRPGWGYLSVGAGTVGTIVYSAYLGGRMVYGEGLGVGNADGLRSGQSPPVGFRNIGEVLRTAGRQIKETVTELLRGLFVRDTDFGPDEARMQRDIESDTASAGALPLGSAPRAMK